MENINLLLENSDAFTKPEEKILVNIFSSILSAPEKKSKEPEKLEIVSMMINFLNKIYFSNLDISREEKSYLVKLIDKFQSHKEIIEIMPNIDNDKIENIVVSRERFAKKMQSSFSSDLFLKKLKMYLEGELNDEEAQAFLNEAKAHPHLLIKMLRIKKYREQIMNKLNFNRKDVSKEEMEKILDLEIQRLSQNG